MALERPMTKAGSRCPVPPSKAGLVRAGLEKELPAPLRAQRQPRIVVSSGFEFEKLERKADYAIAQSLFSHLPPDLIEACVRKLAPAMVEGGLFYATYFETPTRIRNPSVPHDHGYFAYTADEMCAFAGESFEPRYIGNWNHPREQVMVEYRRTAG